MTIVSNCTASVIQDAAESLLAGNLVAFPTETVYGLGADATNEKAVARIYEVKGRPTNHPLIVHISSINNLDKWAKDIPEYAVKLARAFWPGPMTLILSRTDLAKDFITGGQNNVGIRVPAHSVALALLKEFESQGGIGIAAPSANRFGKISPTSADNVKTELFDYFNQQDIILNGGPSVVGLESTIINCTQNFPAILRPGAITHSMVKELLGPSIKLESQELVDQIKAPGLFTNHYMPNAKLYLSGTPKPGDGYIALDIYPTPLGVIRLASPTNNTEYAKILYKALHLADSKKISKIFVIPPIGDDIAIAIRDRLVKAAKKK